MVTAGKLLGMSPIFIGVIALAVVGTISDLIASIYFAWQNKMSLVLSICIGSATQIALAMAPILVIISWLLGNPLSLVFGSPLELFAIAGAVYIVNSIAGDGEVTWYEGLLLTGVYVLFALGFWFIEVS